MSNNIVPIQERGGGLDSPCKEPKLASDEKSATRDFCHWWWWEINHQMVPIGFWLGYYPQLTLKKSPNKFGNIQVWQGFEPTTFWSGAQAPNHYTTGPCHPPQLTVKRFYDYDKASCLTRNHVTQGDGMNASVLSRSTSWSEYIQRYIQVVRMLWASGMRRALEVRHMSTEWKVLPGGKCMKLYNVEWHWYRVWLMILIHAPSKKKWNILQLDMTRNQDFSAIRHFWDAYSIGRL